MILGELLSSAHIHSNFVMCSSAAPFTVRLRGEERPVALDGRCHQTIQFDGCNLRSSSSWMTKVGNSFSSFLLVKT